MHILLLGEFPPSMVLLRTLEEQGGHTTRTALTLKEINTILKNGHAFGAIMLSAPLPSNDTAKAIRRIRAEAVLPVIVVLARILQKPVTPRYESAMSATTADCLDAGADDVLAHWMSPREVLARINAAARRYSPQALAPTGFADLKWEAATFTLSRNGKSVVLTKNLATLFALLLQAQPGPASPADYKSSTGAEISSYNAYISHLRRALKDLDSRVIIRNVHKRGCRLVDPEA